MKKLLLLPLLFLSLNSFAQNLPTKQALFEGCTVIIVETPDRAPDAFSKIQKAFKEQGFRIMTTDSDIYTMTASQPLQGAGEMKVTASINQGGSNQIILNGSLSSGPEAGSTSGEAKVANTGGSESASKIAFDKMHQVALAYKGKGAKVLYGAD